MLVHLGEGYCVNLNCIIGAYPDAYSQDICLVLSGEYMINIPPKIKDKLIEEVEKFNRKESNSHAWTEVGL
jgi:hypothetical protein